MAIVDDITAENAVEAQCHALTSTAGTVWEITDMEVSGGYSSVVDN